MKISQNCYFISGLSVEPPWTVNSGFVVGGHTTLIIDTGSNYSSAQTILGYATCAAPKNKLIVVNTEPHFDHIGGNCLFEEKGIEIYAHPKLHRSESDFKQNIKDLNDTILNRVRRDKNEAKEFFYNTTLVNPTRSTLNVKQFDIGGVSVLVNETPGHTPFNISLFELKDRVLFCGDTIVTGYLPNLEAGNATLWKKWLETLIDIRNLSPQIIITGHGYSIVGSENIKEEIERMEKIIRTAIIKNAAPTA